LALTETKLLEQTASILGISLAQLVKAGTLVYAKREFLNHNKYSAAEGGDSKVCSLALRFGRGRRRRRQDSRRLNEVYSCAESAGRDNTP
jgi:hypothetical protein